MSAVLQAALPTGDAGEFRCFEYLITYLDTSKTRHVKIRRAVSADALRRRIDKQRKRQQQQQRSDRHNNGGAEQEQEEEEEEEEEQKLFGDNFAMQCEYITLAPSLTSTEKQLRQRRPKLDRNLTPKAQTRLQSVNGQSTTSTINNNTKVIFIF